jgi:hypothetical protein
MIKWGLVLLVFVSMLTLSCETFHSEIEPASYIYVKPFEIKVDSSLDEMLWVKSTKITDVWLYLDESQYQGAYELPAIIPIVEKGNHKISLRPGIKNSGITTDRRIYPFYAEYEINNFTLKPNYVDTITPSTKYDLGLNGIEFAWYENFETLFSSWTHHKSSDTVVNFVSDTNVFDGKFSGGIFLDKDDLFFEMISAKSLTDLPRNGIPIYLELNYKTDHRFIVGLYASNKTQQIPVYTITEKENWNKIYLDLTDYINLNYDAEDFNVFIGISKTASEGEVKMYIDNIKLIYFK